MAVNYLKKTPRIGGLIFMLFGLPISQSLPAEINDYDADAALQHSQAAIGRTLGDYEFSDSDGKQVKLSDYLGKPLLISLVYSSCDHTCPVTTRHLKKAVLSAREVFEPGSFGVLTIGFDTVRDSPERMHVFAREQDIDIAEWVFLSASPSTIVQLIDDVGFIYFPTPRGFDHIAQVTVVDGDGVIYQQVYGEMFQLPWLVEPLKDLVFNRSQSRGHFLSGLADRVRLFCTVYDPTTNRYKFDYSLFVQIAVGLSVILSLLIYLVREIVRARRN